MKCSGLWRKGKGTLVALRGAFFHCLSPPSCPLFIFDLLRQNFKEVWHHWLWKNALFYYFLHLLIIKFFSACQSPNNNGNCLRIWDELTYHKKVSILVSLSFFFMLLVLSLQTQCNENFPWGQRKADKELWEYISVFPRLSEKKKISSINALSH